MLEIEAGVKVSTIKQKIDLDLNVTDLEEDIADQNFKPVSDVRIIKKKKMYEPVHEISNNVSF